MSSKEKGNFIIPSFRFALIWGPSDILWIINALNLSWKK